MSAEGKITWTIRLQGRFRRYGETIDIAASPGVSGGTIKALIAHALQARTNDPAVGSLVGVSVLTTDRGVMSDRDPPPEGASLSIIPPACG